MQTRIRMAAPADVAALALVGGASFLETFHDSIPGADMLAHVRHRHADAVYAAWLAAPDADCWLAEAPMGAPLGYAVLTTPDLPDDILEDGDLELRRIYVLSVAHGTGTGARLMQAAIDSATARGAGRLLLGVYDANVRAIGFYRRMGFAEIGTRTFTVGTQRFDDLVFARAL